MVPVAGEGIKKNQPRVSKCSRGCSQRSNPVITGHQAHSKKVKSTPPLLADWTSGYGFITSAIERVSPEG